MASNDTFPQTPGTHGAHGTADAPDQRNLPMYKRTHGNPRTARRTRIWVVFGGIAAVCFAIANVWLAGQRDPMPQTVEGVIEYPIASAAVVSGPVTYAQVPPAGGDHAELPQLCGFYRVPIADENAVATLATGAIWATYRPDIADTEVEHLLDDLQGEYDVLLSPYPGQESPIMLTAWGRQLPLDSASDDRLAYFLVLYTNDEAAPLADEPCSRGVGLPQP